MVVALGTSAKKYACPRCNAKPGEPCRTPKGRLTEYPHVERGALLTSSDVANAEIKPFDLVSLFKTI